VCLPYRSIYCVGSSADLLVAPQYHLVPRSHHIYYGIQQDLGYPTATFVSQWCPLRSMDFNNLVVCQTSNIVPTLTARLDNLPITGSVQHKKSPKLMLYSSPIRCGAYKLFVFLSGTICDAAVLSSPPHTLQCAADLLLHPCTCHQHLSGLAVHLRHSCCRSCPLQLLRRIRPPAVEHS
jgi:hypothetical protein